MKFVRITSRRKQLTIIERKTTTTTTTTTTTRFRRLRNLTLRVFCSFLARTGRGRKSRRRRNEMHFNLFFLRNVFAVDFRYLIEKL